ncbi:hypothetical protein HYC85_031799 [Camellia sinensis]|uniref:Uncharacterized protein n=1 Tax=Camellia sinensis TaxID=4442 RepID=A0A7J7FV67_CAMSI|nr:hypothetical protein HYC85_031799 [Camellia sinensis]
MGEVMKTSSFALTEAKYIAGENIKHTVLENVQTASLKVQSRQENIAGVKLPKFEYFTEGETKNNLNWTGKRWPASAGLSCCICEIH